jgi:hypothetical protein
LITNHGEERIRKRAGLNRKACDRLAMKALAEGTWRKNVHKRKLRRYLDYWKHKGDGELVVYGENVFVFDNNVCVTMWQLPNGMRNII